MFTWTFRIWGPSYHTTELLFNNTVVHAVFLIPGNITNYARACSIKGQGPGPQLFSQQIFFLKFTNKNVYLYGVAPPPPQDF